VVIQSWEHQGMATKFRGWPDAALDFFRGIEVDNTKTYWTEHRSTYEADVKAPFEALSELVAEEFGPLKLTRPYRDIRFSKDKSPYKTRAYATGEGEGGERYYVAISPTGLTAGSGYWMMSDDQLARFRVAVDDDAAGAELEDTVAGMRAARLDTAGDSLKTAPRGYRRDHPRIELLRHKGLAGVRDFEPAGWLHTAGAARRVTDTWRAAAPLNAWLNRHVGPSTELPQDAGRYG
jgi:uncharacterized protein (TIGR02453 family)